MASGGIYDHIGGGFFRYSVDEKWLIPHYEKMLYVNAQLARLYLLAYTLFHDDSLKAVALETLGYMDRELMSEQGVYYASQDADSEGQEGKFYLWTYEEIVTILGKKAAPQFCSLFHIEKQGNVPDGLNLPYTGFPGKNTEPVELTKKLFEARTRRKKPLIDNKILVDWNALALSALVSAYKVTSLNYYIERAQQVYSFIRNTMFHDTILYHCWIDNEVRIKGFIDDYAYLINALLDLHQCVQDKSIFTFAAQLTEIMLDQLYDPVKGLLFSSPEKHTILTFTIPHDSATPSGSAVAALLLIRMSKIFDNQEYLRIAEQTIHVPISRAVHFPLSYSQMLLAFMELITKR
jgi:uncharacterized protein YyaL (SSP411 family)